MSAGTRKPPRLLDQVRRRLRAQHLSLSTEKSYVSWIRRFILYHGKRHPKEMAEPEINAFLSHLAADRHVSASTQNQALSAILFLYRHVLDKELGDFGDVIRARKPRKLPVVLTRVEVENVLAAIDALICSGRKAGWYTPCHLLRVGSGYRFNTLKLANSIDLRKHFGPRAVRRSAFSGTAENRRRFR